MEVLPFELRAGQLNQTYEKVRNCRVTKPPYSIDGFHSAEFFLDKRFGLSPVYADATKEFLDYYDVEGTRYYYYLQGGRAYLGTYDGTAFHVVTPGGFAIDSLSPRKLAYGRNVYGPKHSTGTIASPQVGIGGSFPVGGMDDYQGGYVKFSYTGTTGIAVGDHLLFKGATSVLKGGLNRVEYVSGSDVYIIGTNSRGSVPKAGDQFDLYKAATSDNSNCLVIGHVRDSGGWAVSIAILDGNNTANIVEVLSLDSPVTDIANFDTGIFALTPNRMYFSRSTYDDNTQFYPLDNYKVDNAYSLFPMGKAMLVFGRTNKLFAAANATNQNIGYVGYDVNYNGNTFSKKSFTFSDQTIYIVQDDLQLMQVDIVQNNSTTFDLVVKNVLLNTRGIFEDVSGGTIEIHNHGKFLHFVHVKDGSSTDYEYDKQYQHWIVQDYAGKAINKFSEHVLMPGKIATVGASYDDLGTTYEQEVNFMIVGGQRIYMPYTVRTGFGLTDTPIDVTLDMEFELGGRMEKLSAPLSNYAFDQRLSHAPTGDELIGYEQPGEITEFDGTTVSIQTNVLKTGRYCRFKYHGPNRFSIGDSHVFTDFVKPFVHEINQP